MLTAIHSLMDEKVDVYSENEKFTKLLQLYNSTRDDKYIKDMWPIMFRCASNILKIRFGKVMNWEEIAEHAINMCEILLNRIKNKDKYPDGYPVLNLPTMVKYTILNEFYAPNKVKDKELDSNSISFEEVESCIGYEVTDDGEVVLYNKKIKEINDDNDTEVY